MRISVIGAGSSYTPELLKGLREIRDDIDLEEICLYDINEEKLKTIEGFSRRFLKGEVNIVTERIFEDCVRDASYVIFQFRPGGLEGRLKDETIPLKYDLVGQETTGMGGFAMAMRAFPVVEDYINRIEKTSRAFVVNFTNPSGHVTEFVLNYLDYDRFVGLCNIPINLLKAVADMFNVGIEDVFFKYYGLNHLTFLEKVYVKNEEVTEKVLEKVEYAPANFDSSLPIDLVKTLGLFPNSYLKYYLLERKVVKDLKSSTPRAKVVMDIERDLFKKYESASDIPQELSKRGGSMYSTAAALLIRDLHLSNGAVHIVNTRNSGAVSNMPHDYVMEIPSTTRGGKVFPVSIGEADPFAIAFVHNIKMYERLAIEAYLKRSKKLALKAILLHPLGPDYDFAENLLDDLIEAHGFDLK